MEMVADNAENVAVIKCTSGCKVDIERFSVLSDRIKAIEQKLLTGN
jgi:hypothetical protein